MAGHAQSKFVMTECSKTQIRLMGLNYKTKTKCWCRGNTAAEEQKANYEKVEIILFVMKPSNELSVVSIEITIQI